jgi:hypothetical protein
MLRRKLIISRNHEEFAMLAKQYSHRLPSSYDMGIIRERAARRGPLWDATEGLGFKAFVARERGRYGATANVYSAVYLWLDVEQTADFFMGSRFQNVIDDFGRPDVETWLPLDARVALAAHLTGLALTAGAIVGFAVLMVLSLHWLTR